MDGNMFTFNKKLLSETAFSFYITQYFPICQYIRHRVNHMNFPGKNLLSFKSVIRKA